MITPEELRSEADEAKDEHTRQVLIEAANTLEQVCGHLQHAINVGKEALKRVKARTQ